MLLTLPLSFPGAWMFFISNQTFIRCSWSPVDSTGHHAEPIQCPQDALNLRPRK